MIIHIAGACVWDERLVVDKLQNGESVPMQSHTQLGGVARNVAFALKQAAPELKLITHFIRGDDQTGEALDKQLAQHGFPPASVVKGTSTARYLSIEDKSGKVLHGLADMEIHEHFPMLQDCKGQALVMDTNFSLSYFQALNVQIPVYLVATSPTKIQHAATCLHKFKCLFLNRQEAIVLAGKPNASLQDLASNIAKNGPQQILITDGANRPVVYDRGHCEHVDQPPVLAEKQSHNGLGDRLAGLTLGLLFQRQLTLTQAVNLALSKLKET